MGFWNSVKQFFSSQESVKNNDWSGAGYSFTPWANTDFYGSHNQALKNSEVVFSVITRLANTISTLPVHEYCNYSERHDGVADLLTYQANPSMSAFQLLNQMEVSRDTEGNAYALIERDQQGTPIALWPIDPRTVVVKKNLDDNSIWYDINSDEFHMLVFNTEVIHVKHISPLTGVLGISPLDVLQGTLKFSGAAQEFSLSEMDKKDSYIIKYDRSVSPENRQAMINDFVRMIKENGGAVVQEKGFEYERFQSDFQPGDLSTAEGITRSRVANVYNVPIQFLNQQQTTTSENNEELMSQFVQMTVLPIVKQYESEFNRKLLTPSQRERGFYFKFNINGLLRGDTASRTNFYQMMIRNGIATSNDLRKLEDLPPTDNVNGDQLWITGDLYPLNASVDERNAKSPLKGGENDFTEVSKTGSPTGR